MFIPIKYFDYSTQFIFYINIQTITTNDNDIIYVVGIHVDSFIFKEHITFKHKNRNVFVNFIHNVFDVLMKEDRKYYKHYTAFKLFAKEWKDNDT